VRSQEGVTIDRGLSACCRKNLVSIRAGALLDERRTGEVSGASVEGMTIMLRIHQSIVDRITNHAERMAPIEACGYLGGAGGVITESVELRNVDNSAEHFAFDPAEQFGAIRQLRARGLKALAVYHSHPATPARPSEEDIRLANDPSVSYVIVSLADGVHTVKSFRIAKGIAEHEDLHIVEQGGVA